MSTRNLIWIGMLIGSTIGGFIPMLWNADLFSFSSIFLTAVGGLLGIWIGFKVSNL